ncbi:MAG: hypothetical protein QM831_28600 [Kofleriaceae bacterium]
MTRFVWLLVGGCSFGLTAPDPSLPLAAQATCNASKSSVITDGVFGTASGVATITLAATVGAVALLPALIGAVYFGAAVHGNNATNDCRAAKAQYIASLQAPPVPRLPVIEAQPVIAPAATPPPPPPPVVVDDKWGAFWKAVP